MESAIQNRLSRMEKDWGYICRVYRRYQDKLPLRIREAFFIHSRRVDVSPEKKIQIVQEHRDEFPLEPEVISQEMLEKCQSEEEKRITSQMLIEMGYGSVVINPVESGGIVPRMFTDP